MSDIRNQIPYKRVKRSTGFYFPFYFRKQPEELPQQVNGSIALKYDLIA